MEHLISKEFLAESKNRFESSFKRLFHCLDQLDEKQIWWKPNNQMNSIGILIKHISGNLRQWIVTQINNSEDHRNRPEEFRDDKKLTKEELVQLAKRINSDFLSAINTFNASRLNEPKRIQGYDITIMVAIFRALTHLEGHVGQIILLTRLQLGENYTILWQPKTEEQKSEVKS